MVIRANSKWKGCLDRSHLQILSDDPVVGEEILRVATGDLHIISRGLPQICRNKCHLHTQGSHLGTQLGSPV